MSTIVGVQIDFYPLVQRIGAKLRTPGPVWRTSGAAAVIFGLILGGRSLGHAAALGAGEGLSERWGEFQWLSPWIETTGIYEEPRAGEFKVGGASFGGRWTGRASQGQWVEAQVAVGTRSLISRPTRYAPLSGTERASDPAIVDAYAGLNGDWGRLRLGLVPLVFGLEEGIEADRHWLRPMILRRGLVGLRDVGLSYAINAGGFYSDWIVHNGEGGDDRDGEMWGSARWEYRLRTDRAAWRLGASGQVGRTTPQSTHPTGTTATAAELDPDQPARLRLGGFHFSAEWLIGAGNRGATDDRRFGIEVETLGAEVLQDARSRRLRSVRADIEWEPLLKWGFLARYEMFDPDSQIADDVIQEASFGLQYYPLEGSLKHSMRIIVVGTKEWVESREQDRHRADLAFRFSPNF